MNPRTTGILFLLAIALGAFIYLYELRGGEERRAAEATHKRLFPDIEATDIDEITLTTSDGRRARLERLDKGWWLSSPLPFPGDDATLESMVDVLAQIEVEGRVEGAGSLDEFGLADEAAQLGFRVGGERYGLLIGERTPVGSNTYVKTLSDEAVVYLQTWRVNALRKSLTELRDRRVVDFDHAAVQRVVVRWPDGRVELERREFGWWLVHPLVEPADGATVETLLSDLAFLRAEGFIDEQPPAEELGLAEPPLHILLSGAAEQGEPFELGFALGAVRQGKRVARGTAGALYEVSPQRLEDFPRELVAYRFKQLARFEAADARSFELVFAREGEEARRVEGELVESGWLTRPERMAAGKIGALVAELARLEGIDIVADTLGEPERAALGLSPARVAIRVWGEAEAPLAELALGRLEPGRGLLAQRIDKPVVYLLDEGLAGQIPISYEALLEGFLEAPEIEEIEGGEEDGEETEGEAPVI